MKKPIMFTMVILLSTLLISTPCLAEVEKPDHWFRKPFKKLWTAVLDLQSQINVLKAANETLLTRVDDLETQNETLQSDLADANDAISSLQSQLTTALNDIGANATAINDLQTDVEAQQQLTSYMSVNTVTHEVFFTGANVYIQNGSDETSGTPNGHGNLIIGYNEMRPADNVRSGSHNLVMGSENNFNSSGGIVIGNHVDQDGAVTIDSNSNIYIRGFSVNLSSSTAMDLDAVIMNLDSIGTMSLAGALIQLN